MDIALGKKFGSKFMTIKELLNGPPMKEILDGNLEIPIDDVLTFVVDGNDTFNQVYAKLFEPFEPFDILLTGDDEVDDTDLIIREKSFDLLLQRPALQKGAEIIYALVSQDSYLHTYAPFRSLYRSK